MNQLIINRLTQLRSKMKEYNIDAYIIPTNDYHGSEYISDYFKQREYMSGFTGSAGTLLVLKDEALLYTDGRYFLQAGKELNNTTITLMKMGEENVLSLFDYLKCYLPNNSTIGFDGRVVSSKYVANLKASLSNKNINIVSSYDLVGMIWDNRPYLIPDNVSKVKDHNIMFCGINRCDKIEQVRNYMKEHNYDYYILTSLDDIAWLLNIRGNDVMCNPVVISYVVISMDYVKLFIHKEKLDSTIYDILTKDNILIHEYDNVYSEIKNIHNSNVYLDSSKVNYYIYSLIDSSNNIYSFENITTRLKSIKNEVEVKGAYKACLKDGIALTKLIYFIKHNDMSKLTELDIVNKYEELRKDIVGYHGISFETISGYSYHGAIIHYEPTIDTNIYLDNKSYLLIDCGGQYDEGTTDVTRTISLGFLTEEERRDYTLVLKGHINLLNAKFIKGVTGAQLDILARSPLYEYGLNYNHGTGHGVGSYLNVHEGPQNISSVISRSNVAMLPGMITSCEPGIYKENKYGIRIENTMVCKEYLESEMGKFLEFDSLTLVPYDIQAIDRKYLNESDIKFIHSYHERVYNSLKDYLTKEELSWLESIKEAI